MEVYVGVLCVWHTHMCPEQRRENSSEIYAHYGRLISSLVSGMDVAQSLETIVTIDAECLIPHQLYREIVAGMHKALATQMNTKEILVAWVRLTLNRDNEELVGDFVETVLLLPNAGDFTCLFELLLARHKLYLVKYLKELDGVDGFEGVCSTLKQEYKLLINDQTTWGS